MLFRNVKRGNREINLREASHSDGHPDCSSMTPLTLPCFAESNGINLGGRGVATPPSEQKDKFGDRAHQHGYCELEHVRTEDKNTQAHVLRIVISG